MKRRKSLGSHDQTKFKEQVWFELRLKGGRSLITQQTWRRGVVEAGSLETFNLQTSLGDYGEINSLEEGSSGSNW